MIMITKYKQIFIENNNSGLYLVPDLGQIRKLIWGLVPDLDQIRKLIWDLVPDLVQIRKLIWGFGFGS